MRLAHHLIRHPSGMWHFRLTVPKDLREAIGLRVVKRSLRTRDPAMARMWAYALGAHCGQIFATARQLGKGMGGKHWDDDAVARMMEGIVTNAPQGPARWEVQGPGGWALRTDGSDRDNAAGLDALKAMLASRPLAPEPAPVQASTAPTLAEAMATYEDTEVPNLKPDTWEQRKRACASFIKVIGGEARVDEITRPMASKWAIDLQRSGLSKRYVANMVSHVSQLFESQVQAGHVHVGHNPVKGVVVMKKAEKRALRESGHAWEALPIEALQRIYDPANLKRSRMIHVRWGALLGLYTGARVAEVAQIFLCDFDELDGVKCVRLTSDSDGQSVKNEHSKRLVPLHPDLLKLGLWDRVETLRRQGAERLFPNMRIDSKSGAGNAISKGFSYYLGTLGIKPRRAAGTVGFHSLRKSVVQTLQGSAMPAERRRALVGHEPGDDVHRGDYMRPWTAKELATFFPGLPWGGWLNFEGLRPLLNAKSTMDKNQTASGE